MQVDSWLEIIIARMQLVTDTVHFYIAGYKHLALVYSWLQTLSTCIQLIQIIILVYSGLLTINTCIQLITDTYNFYSAGTDT